MAKRKKGLKLPESPWKPKMPKMPPPPSPSGPGCNTGSGDSLGRLIKKLGKL